MTTAQETIRNLFVISLLLPLASAVIITLLTRKVLFKAAGWLAFGMMVVSFLCAATVLVKWMGLPHLPHTAETPFTWNIPWIPIPGTQAGWLYLGVMVDGLTVAMMTMVTGISALVHLYSIGYMEGDKRYNRFFAYLSLFTFSMLGIVLANSIMMLFVFWELVGLTSYLLIGFWFEKRGPQLACKKAFVMNRIGDMGFLIGFGIFFYHLGGNVLLPVHGGMFEAIRCKPSSSPRASPSSTRPCGSPPRASASSAAPSASPPSSRSTPGSPTPWKARRPSPPSSTPPPWSPPASTSPAASIRSSRPGRTSSSPPSA